MQKGISLIELAQKITANRSLKLDAIAPANQLRMDADGDAVAVLSVPTVGTLPVLPTAHGQIATFTEIPQRYYDRMRSEDPALLATNVNRWFRDSDKTRMVRTLGGDVRAFLSDRYNRIENEEIAGMAAAAIPDGDRAA